ncbi:MAG: MurR/RpiR family transcriptional regulator [Rhizobiaceae bacterium]|nr:MurR/RpiR family transcriptional regulator [Rhizobiaceae bacterium]
MKTDRTVAERIRAEMSNLTRAERQLANAILDNYPISGLGSITALSKTSRVSNPTIVRMVKKLGFAGFPQLQVQLRSEVEATISNPITRHDRWAQSVPDTHLLNQFAAAAMENMRQTISQINPDEFDAVASLLSDKTRHIHIAGGRITHPIADYFYTHLQMMRDGLTMIPPNMNTWPHYLLSMKPGDVLIVFDIRRYELEVSKLAEAASGKDMEIVLFTDQWGSPITKFASHSFHSRIEAPSAWDSNMVIMFIVEAIIAAVQNETWEETKQRMNTLEEMFDQSKQFKKFI